MAIPTTILPCTHVGCRSPWLETPSPCCLPFSLADVAPPPGKHILSLDEFLKDTNPDSDWITDRDGVQDYVGGNLLDGHGFYLASSVEERIQIIFQVKDIMRGNISSVMGRNKDIEIKGRMGYELISWIYFHTRCLEQLDREFHPSDFGGAALSPLSCHRMLTSFWRFQFI